jgi:hypothetical protein
LLPGSEAPRREWRHPEREGITMTDEATTPTAAPEGWYVVHGRRLYWTGTIWEAINGRTPNMPPPVVGHEGLEELGAPTGTSSGWYRVDGGMLYWDGVRWLDAAGSTVEGAAPRPRPSAAAAPATAGSTGLLLGIAAILLGILIFFLIPATIAVELVVLCLVLTGVVVISAWNVVRHLYLIRNLPRDS